MEGRGLPAAVLAAAADRRGGALEVAATALDGLLEVAADPPRLEQAVGVLLAGQPAMAPIWHLARAARGPDPPAALAALRRHLDTDADAAVTAATAWLHHRLAGDPGAVATVSHSSLVARVLTANLAPEAEGPVEGRIEGQAEGQGEGQGEDRGERRGEGQREGRGEGRVTPPSSGLSGVPRWGSVADGWAAGPSLSTAPGAPVVGLVGADAIGPGAVLNAAGTGELAARLPTLVVATAIKLVPAEVFGRLGGPGFETVPLETVAAVVVGAEVLSPAEAGRRAGDLGPAPPV
jgi:hypothetical protein